MKFKRAGIIIFVIISCLLAGCAGDEAALPGDEGAPVITTTPEATTTTPATTTTAATTTTPATTTTTATTTTPATTTTAATTTTPATTTTTATTTVAVTTAPPVPANSVAAGNVTFTMLEYNLTPMMRPLHMPSEHSAFSVQFSYSGAGDVDAALNTLFNDAFFTVDGQRERVRATTTHESTSRVTLYSSRANAVVDSLRFTYAGTELNVMSVPGTGIVIDYTALYKAIYDEYSKKLIDQATRVIRGADLTLDDLDLYYLYFDNLYELGELADEGVSKMIDVGGSESERNEWTRALRNVVLDQSDRMIEEMGVIFP